jgi:hypothetical protein
VASVGIGNIAEAKKVTGLIELFCGGIIVLFIVAALCAVFGRGTLRAAGGGRVLILVLGIMIVIIILSAAMG